jgi:predicted DNA-binding transcriptional regulator YafY
MSTSKQKSKFNVRKELEMHRNGFQYVVEPYAVVWNRDHYYLIAHEDGFDGLKTFRVDRLYKVDLMDERFEDPHFNVAQYINQAFNMYPGEITTIRVKFQNSLLNVVMDRFGEQVSLYPADNDSFVIVIEAAMSEGLLRWLLTWGADAQVLSPPELVERMKEESKRMVSLYSLG